MVEGRAGRDPPRRRRRAVFILKRKTRVALLRKSRLGVGVAGAISPRRRRRVARLTHRQVTKRRRRLVGVVMTRRYLMPICRTGQHRLERTGGGDSTLLGSDSNLRHPNAAGKGGARIAPPRSSPPLRRRTRRRGLVVRFRRAWRCRRRVLVVVMWCRGARRGRRRAGDSLAPDATSLPAATVPCELRWAGGLRGRWRRRRRTRAPVEAGGRWRAVVARVLREDAPPPDSRDRAMAAELLAVGGHWRGTRGTAPGKRGAGGARGTRSRQTRWLPGGPRWYPPPVDFMAERWDWILFGRMEDVDGYSRLLLIRGEERRGRGRERRQAASARHRRQEAAAGCHGFRFDYSGAWQARQTDSVGFSRRREQPGPHPCP